MMRVHTYTGNVKQEKNNPPVEFDVNQSHNKVCKPMKGNLHVVQHGKRWEVKAEKIPQPVSRHNTQVSAIEAATRLVKQDHAEIFIHGRNGRIRERNTFGNDPFPPRG